MHRVLKVPSQTLGEEMYPINLWAFLQKKKKRPLPFPSTLDVLQPQMGIGLVSQNQYLIMLLEALAHKMT